MKIRYYYFLVIIGLSACNEPNPILEVPQQPKRIPVPHSFIEFAHQDTAVNWKTEGDSIALSYYFDVNNLYHGDILTFRGNAQRNAPVRGYLSKVPDSLVVDWTFHTAIDNTLTSFGWWGGGAGWTGQPLLVNWKPSELPDSLFAGFRSTNKNLQELIQVSLCGQIYFLDFATGKPTRKSIHIHNPIKGTPSIDRDRTRLLVGQGIPETGTMGYRFFDLKNQNLLHKEQLPNIKSPRYWGACDASPLIDNYSNDFIWPTESGMIYCGKMNAPKQTKKFTYRIPSCPHQGIESSPSAYKNLVYFTDNGGQVICLNTATNQPVWHFDNHDDSDASPVVEVKEEHPFVYVCNEVDKQGKVGIGGIRKLDGMTGKLMWEYTQVCNSGGAVKILNGGILATPLLGIEQAEHIVWATFSRVNETSEKGKLVALNNSNGALIYEIELPAFSWTSPIALYTQDGKPYLYTGDASGMVYLFDGLTGKLIHKLAVGATVESSAIAYGNRIIQPLRGDKIISLLVK